MLAMLLILISIANAGIAMDILTPFLQKSVGILMHDVCALKRGGSLC